MVGEKGDEKKARHWQELLREAARSEISIREFCRRRRLSDWRRGRFSFRLPRREGRRSQRGSWQYCWKEST